MAYLPFIVALNARDRRQSTDADSVAVAAVSIAGTEINSTNVVTSNNSKILSNKTISGLSNTLQDIQAESLSSGAKEAVLAYRKSAVWNQINSLLVVGSNSNVTRAVETAATTRTPTLVPTYKGILTTGVGSGGVGIENYTVLLRHITTGDPINDGDNGTVYAQLVHENAVVPSGVINVAHGTIAVSGTDTTFLIDYQVGDGLYSASGDLIGYVASVLSNTYMTLQNGAFIGVLGQGAYQRHRFSLYFKKRSGAIYNFSSNTWIDFLFAEVFDYNDRPWRADLYGTGFVDTVTSPVSHYHSASDINTGTLSTDRFSAIAGLVAESAIGTGANQVAAGNHAHTFSQITGTLSSSQFSAYADLVDENKIGTGSTQVAAGDHTHPSAYSNLVDNNSIGTGSTQVAAGNHAHSFSQITGMLSYSQFSAYGDLSDEGKIGTDADQVAAGNHTHAFNQITGTLSSSQFSAYADLVDEGKIGTGANQVAAGDHTHTDLGGAPGFPYSQILSFEAITIPARQQMRVYQELKVEGELIVYGELIVKDI